MISPNLNWIPPLLLRTYRGVRPDGHDEVEHGLDEALPGVAVAGEGVGEGGGEAAADADADAADPCSGARGLAAGGGVNGGLFIEREKNILKMPAATDKME